MGLSAYSNEDLFHQEALLKGVSESLQFFLDTTKALHLIMVVGAPLQVDSLLFNCGVVVYHGKILGIAVKSYLPNYRNFTKFASLIRLKQQLQKRSIFADKRISLSGQT